jgi:Tol biopolymer transport system component
MRTRLVPDGSQIALVSDKQDPGNSDLYVMDLKTKELNRLTDDPALDAEPSWSPDGSKIAFTSDRDGFPNVNTLEVDSGETIHLTQGFGFDGQPDWSPDGEKILFVSNREGDAEIYVMDADGENPLQLTTTPGKDIHPEWSPDGKYFAYAHEEDDARSIYVAGLDGSSPDLLLENTGGWPAWSVAEATLTEDPVFVPLCARDTDGDFEPDTLSTTSQLMMIWVSSFSHTTTQRWNGLLHTLDNHPIVEKSTRADDGREWYLHRRFALQHATGLSRYCYISKEK